MFLPPFRANPPQEVGAPSAQAAQAAANTAQQALDSSLGFNPVDVDMSAVFNFSGQPSSTHSPLTSVSQPSPSLATATPSVPSAARLMSSKQDSRMPEFSASTQEILRRISSTHNVAQNSPEWEAARQQVLRNMAAAPGQSPPQPSAGFMTPVKRGRGRGRPPNSIRLSLGRGTTNGDAPALPDGLAGMTPHTDAGIPRVRGRGGRPRGSGRGASKGRRRKRKRDESDDGNDGPSSSSSSDELSTPKAPTVTKSGRSITKPAAFTPVIEKTTSQHNGLSTNSPHTPSSASRRGLGSSRGRGGRRPTRPPEFALCAKCTRGHSPESNVIVFCDGCNTPFHQWCHDPPIAREVVEVAEKEWFCSACEHRREEERVPLESRVSWEARSQEERLRYLDSLGAETLRVLLGRALRMRPELPIFPPERVALGKEAEERARKEDTASSALTPLDGMTPAPPGGNSAATDAYDGGANGSIASQQRQQQRDPYPDIAAAAATNDPPSTYPRPGNGPIRPKPTTDPDDVAWLVDDENGFNVFSHFVDEVHASGDSSIQNKVNGVNGANDGLVNVAGTGEPGRKGSWIKRVG